MNQSPLILAFDTSGAFCAAALLRGETVLDQHFEAMKKGQAERLMGLLEEMLRGHDLRYSDLDAIGVGIGPGNFTGIRIGVAAARGLGLGLNIPSYGVDGFDQRALALGTEAPCIPAPRAQAYQRVSGEVRMIDTPAPEGEPSPDTLAVAIAQITAQRWPAATPAPAPYYVRAPDAAPARDAPPVILPQ